MSETEYPDRLDSDNAAFEYVIGTLKGQARTDFEALKRQNESLQNKVSNWEERLVSLYTPELARKPTKNNWSAIDSRINSRTQSSHASAPGLLTRLFWLLTATMTLVLMFNTSLFKTGFGEDVDELPIDYMAVMTTMDGKVALSAIAKGDAKRMWLQWGEDTLTTEQNYQLWGVSRSDGETRSISVIANSNTEILELSEAEWRLVKDADSLLLTIEEVGGSAIDEPSNRLVAKGLCVRLTRTDRDA